MMPHWVQLDDIIEVLGTLDNEQLDLVQDAVKRRRKEITKMIIIERRLYRGGRLQLETLPYPPTGKHYGPYWHFHWYAAGTTHAIYVGKTDVPESVVDAKLALKDPRVHPRPARSTA